MASNVEKLVVSLSADIRQYQRALDRANGVTAKRASAIEKRLRAMNRNIDRMGRAAFTPLTAAATAALAPILSVAGAISGAKAALSDFDRIGKQAKAGGLDAETFQEYAYAAELGGVATDQFSQALNTFAKNTGTAAIGKGELVEKLRQLNPELLKNLQLAQNQEQRFRLVADAISKESDAARRAAIASAAFGDAGVKMVEMLKNGSAALDDTAAKARDLGLVVDRDLIARSEELNDQFSTATSIIDKQFKQALVDLAPVLIGAANLAGDVASAVRGIVDAMRDLETRSARGLQDQLAALGKERLDVERAIGEERERQDNAANRRVHKNIGTIIDGHKQRLAAIAAEEAKILSILDARDKRAGADTTLPTITARGEPPVSSERGSSRNAAAEAALREAEAVKRLIADLQAERAEIGMSNIEKRISQTLRQAGVAAASAEGQAIAGLIRQIETETAAVEANNAAQEQRKQAIESLFGMGGDALMSIVDGSAKAEDAVKKLAIQLALAAAQAALLGSGPLAGIFSGGGFVGGISGTAMSAVMGGAGGLYDKGGYTGPGGKYQPAGVVHKGEYVFSKAAVDRIGVGNLEAMHRNLKGYAEGGFVAPSVPKLKSNTANAGATYAPTYSIDARGSSNPQETEQLVTAALREYDRGNYQRWLSASAEARKRNAV